MRALLVNPAYPQTFWSFDRVLRLLGKKILDPPLGLLTMAAMLPPSWDLRLAELGVREISEEHWDWCDLVMITGLATQFSGLMDTIREARRRGKFVVVGGPLVFHFPEDALRSGADIVVRGEAESAIDRIVAAIARCESGLVIDAGVCHDLRESSVPRFDLLDLKQYAAMAVQFSRGCPFHCEFCDITLMFGREVRTKDPSQIVQELQKLYDLGWRREIFFVDDNFIGNPARTKRLLAELIPWMEAKHHPFDFHTQASINLAAHPDLMEMMTRAGFYKVFIGIETTDVASLRQTRKHQNAAVNLDDACSKINRAGLQIQAGCILGFDHEESGAGRRLIDFAVRNQIPEMFATLLTAGPGTDLWKRLDSEGRLLNTEMTDDTGSQTGLMNFVPTRPMKEIVEEFIELYDVLYDYGFYHERAFRHYESMGPYPVKKGFLPPYLSEIRAVAITMFRQGLLYPSRWNFWRYLLTGLMKFPKRLPHFITACVVAEHYHDYRETVRTRLEEGLRLLESKGSPERRPRGQGPTYPTEEMAAAGK